ncbi:MAG: DUF1893 domain-containing protein [Candidatus Cryosericum sp.]|nr:DUF1893 domain-containing protein [bacterium]
MTENEQLVHSAIRKGEGTLCAAKDGILVYCFSGQGITDLLNVAGMQSYADCSDLDWGDKLVGRAAALLFTLVHPRSVFAMTMSTGAQDVLHKAGIAFMFDEATPEIRNRTGTGPCPMEAAITGVTEPLLALQILTRLNQQMINAENTNISGKGST